MWSWFHYNCYNRWRLSSDMSLYYLGKRNWHWNWNWNRFFGLENELELEFIFQPGKELQLEYMDRNWPHHWLTSRHLLKSRCFCNGVTVMSAFEWFWSMAIWCTTAIKISNWAGDKAQPSSETIMILYWMVIEILNFCSFFFWDKLYTLFPTLQ